jgi:hypothetical protein
MGVPVAGRDRGGPTECLRPELIITNPPFNHAGEFTLRAPDLASVGVAMLVRTTWIEGIGRYESIFRDRPPTLYAPFVERVPMVKGRWDPAASTATSYAWACWRQGARWSAPLGRSNQPAYVRLGSFATDRCTLKIAPCPLCSVCDRT